MSHVPTLRLSLAHLFWIHLLFLPDAVIGKLQNVALNKDAEMSSLSEYYKGETVATRAVDGNTNQYMGGKSCFFTNAELHPYWKVDLGQTYTIDHVKIYNRLDSCCKNRSRDVVTEVSVDDTNYTTVCFHAGPIPDIYTCDSDNLIQGRWVKLTNSANQIEHFHICEVEVMVQRERFEFHPSVKGTGTVIQSRNVASDIVCAYHCSQNLDCISVNVINSPTGIVCQLLGSNVSVQNSEENVSFWELYI